MNWERLVCAKRFGQASRAEGVGRNPAQRDFDRIVFSSAFRRLQSKTQVFPLPETDFLHTRLTHSLETSCVGRSIGQIAGERLQERGCLKGTTPGEISSILAAATLAHDMGNPPFGHGGEEAISDFFTSPKGAALLTDCTPAERQDLQHFEGNAMGFRVLCRTNPKKSKREGGLGITMATLGAFSKYPCDALSVDPLKRCISRKKFGYFQSERDVFLKLAETLGLKELAPGAFTRHPLAFLVEAADDICYLAMDLEDGYRLGILPFDQAEELYMGVIDTALETSRYDLITDAHERISYLRAVAINELVNQSATHFVDNLDPILAGTFNTPLTEGISGKAALARIRTVSREKIYLYRTAQEIEAAGFEVISGLLSRFTEALMEPDRRRSQKILSLVSPSYIYPVKKGSPYTSFMYLLQYVAGMTDRFALDTYRTLMGISLPTY